MPPRLPGRWRALVSGGVSPGWSRVRVRLACDGVDADVVDAGAAEEALRINRAVALPRFLVAGPAALDVDVAQAAPLLALARAAVSTLVAQLAGHAADAAVAAAVHVGLEVVLLAVVAGVGLDAGAGLAARAHRARVAAGAAVGGVVHHAGAIAHDSTLLGAGRGVDGAAIVLGLLGHVGGRVDDLGLVVLVGFPVVGSAAGGHGDREGSRDQARETHHAAHNVRVLAHRRLLSPQRGWPPLGRVARSRNSFGQNSSTCKALQFRPKAP